MKELANLPRNGRERIKVRLSEFRGARFADIRIFTTASSGELVPTLRGVPLRLDQIGAAIAALQEAERELTAGRKGGR